MILDTTYTDKNNEEQINELVGKSFGFMESIRRKGIGSKRMIVDEASPNMQQYLNTVSALTYANIEMRPLGILIRINKGLKNYTWVIPFYQLVLYKTNGSSIHSQGKFIRFRENTTFKENKLFFGKLLNEKVKYDEQYDFRSWSRRLHLLV